MQSLVDGEGRRRVGCSLTASSTPATSGRAPLVGQEFPHFKLMSTTTQISTAHCRVSALVTACLEFAALESFEYPPTEGESDGRSAADLTPAFRARA
jgi:hypothetical protein